MEPQEQEPQETWVRSLGWEDPLEEEMATHSSILTWKIPWTEKPGGLQSIGLQRVKTQLSTHNSHDNSQNAHNIKLTILTIFKCTLQQCYRLKMWYDHQHCPSPERFSSCKTKISVPIKHWLQVPHFPSVWQLPFYFCV